MKRRLRKNRRIGEFQEFGFDVTFTPIIGITDLDSDKLLDAFIECAIEANSLACGGGGFPCQTMEFYVTQSQHCRLVTESDRRAVQLWLESRADVASFNIGELRDVWQGQA